MLQKTCTTILFAIYESPSVILILLMHDFWKRTSTNAYTIVVSMHSFYEDFLWCKYKAFFKIISSLQS